MAPMPPVITQTAAPNAGVTSGTQVATLAQPGDETDPGPFTYAVDDTVNFAVNAAALDAAADLDGVYPVNVTATAASGTSAPAFANIAVTTAIRLGYIDNPQFPPITPTLPPAPPSTAWTAYLRMATNMVVPLARDGVDFVVARPTKFAPFETVYWDDVLLGARPATIDTVAQDLYAMHPGV